jgi:hypothetical protein
MDKGTFRHQPLNVVFIMVIFVGVVDAILKVLNLVRNRVLTPVEYGLQHNSISPHPLSAPHCLYILNFDFGKGAGRSGGGEPERRLEGP